ncbi:MAG: hypothetical protein AMXMBFR7_03920 [Planctomycetota bacterium]
MNAIAQARYLDPKLLRSIESIELKARLLVEGMYASRHRSPNYGFSVEFVDHREYVVGDEPRTIDWRMLGRTGKYFVKRFEMESNMNVVCLLDISRSMGYQPVDPGRFSKIEFGSYLSAALTYLVSHQQDSAGLFTFNDRIRTFLPPRQGKRHLFAILKTLDQLKAHGETGLSYALKQTAQRMPRRSILILISDCYGEVEDIVDGLRHVAARNHEVVLFHVADRDEVEFPFEEMNTFRDAETGATMTCDAMRQKRSYLDRFGRFRKDLREACAAWGADYRFFTTTDPLEIALRDYLNFRRERAR